MTAMALVDRLWRQGSGSETRHSRNIALIAPIPVQSGGEVYQTTGPAKKRVAWPKAASTHLGLTLPL